MRLSSNLHCGHFSKTVLLIPGVETSVRLTRNKTAPCFIAPKIQNLPRIAITNLRPSVRIATQRQIL